jgi:invasion protein IalB
MAFRRLFTWMMSLALFGVASAPALAQAAEAQNPTQLTNSNLTVNEGVADWTVRCFQVKSIAPCDMVLVASNKETNQRVLLVSIAYVPSKDAYAMQMIVPLGVSLAKGMSLEAGAKPLAGVAFNRCERDGCYIEMPIPNETIQALASGGKTTNISLTPYGKTDVIKLPLSLNGFVDALTKLKGYAKDKASNPPPQ